MQSLKRAYKNELKQQDIHAGVMLQFENYLFCFPKVLLKLTIIQVPSLFEKYKQQEGKTNDWRTERETRDEEIQ